MPKNREEIIESMQKTWEGVSMDVLEVLISSMSHRMNVVICVEGESTRW